MEDQKLYKMWRQYRIAKGQGPSVAGRVMARIDVYEQEYRETAQASDLFMTEFDLFKNRCLRLIGAIGLSAIGIFRICYTFHVWVP